MTHPNARKGKDWERDAERYLNESDEVTARRPRQLGNTDVGDIQAPPFVVQAKNWANTVSALNAGVKGAERQADAASLDYGVALIKSRGKGVSEGRVALTMRTFRRVLTRLLRAERLLAAHAPEAYREHVDAIDFDE